MLHEKSHRDLKIFFLTVPDKPTTVTIIPEGRSLLIMWTYSNPPLTEGAVIAGYHVYVTSTQHTANRTTSQTQLNIAGLTPFTNYTVEVSAYNTRGDGVEQEGPRSDPAIERTLGECTSKHRSL